jgi:hypothetical protein
VDNIMDLVKSSLSNDVISKIGRHLGQDEDRTQGAVSTALPMLIGALSKSAGRDSGEGLARALDTRHSGDILDNVKGFLDAGDFADGAGILGHVLGNKTEQAATALGGSTGLKKEQASSLMAMLAPVVMGALGKVKRQQNFDAGALTKALAGQEREIDKRTPGLMGALGGLLDADGDGDTDLADLLAQGRRGLSKFL